ncbi:hypothetical protein D0865_05375 [Hortaea werneckii]|uniref:Major facilitator superfamily (MFS) profile domain-containing protein n=1 Tax=Hortaea werneckii TaxID=91943 RepID=A0A3M7CM99_HORWE|nr:hypothetical protein D0865_05375 [Hortaea werneckii]
MAFEENGQAVAQDQHSSEKGVEQGPDEKGVNNGVTAHGDEAGEPTVTAKTWIVCVILSLGYGLSFWAVPVMSAIGASIAADLGSPSANSWFVSSWTISITVSFLWFGPNTDILGRRWSLVGGNFVTFVGHIVVASAKYNTGGGGAGQVIAGMVIIGFGGANCQMAAFALPELIPNKWRHIGVVIADAVVYVTVIVAPVTARFGYHDNDWEWNFWGLAIFQFLSFVGLLFLYFPPKHPAGEDLLQALKELDYLGMFLFGAGCVPVLMGIAWAGVYNSSDAHVVAPLVVGFFFLVCFAVWEHFFNIKHPITPTHVFTSSHGRDFTAPAIALGVINMFYYSTSILWPQMITQLYTDGGADWRYAVVLSLPQGFGIFTGALGLTFLGGVIRHWQWQLFGSSFIMVLFGSLTGLVNPYNKGTMIAFTYLSQLGFGWGLYLSIAITQMGVEHKDLGKAGGISGTFRFGAGAIGTTIYSTVLSNSLSKAIANRVPDAALDAGLSQGRLTELLSAVGTADLSTANFSSAVVEAVTLASKQAYCHAFFVVAMTSMAFGIIGLVACACCKDVDHRMDQHIEVFLENDKLADRNKFH